MATHPKHTGSRPPQGTRRRFAAMAALAACLGLAGPAHSQELTLARMNHAAWTAADGAPQGITQLAQAPDGTLWIGAIGGLYHFDGRTFTAYQSPAGQPEMPAEVVHSLLVTRDGTVWAGYYRSGVVRIARGRVTRFDRAGGRPVRVVQGLREARDGSVWGYGDGAVLMRFARGDTAWRLEATPHEGARGGIDGMYLDASDVLWLVQAGRMYRRQLPGTAYAATPAQVDAALDLTESPAGDVWMKEWLMGTREMRLRRFDRRGRPLGTLTLTGDVPDLLHTADGSLLVSLEGGKLHRYRADALTGQARLPLGPRVDAYGGALGPGDEAPTALLLDADGSLWAGGRRGLGRFRAPRLVPFRPDSAVGEWDICATPRGDVFLASDAVFSVSGGVTRKIPGSEGFSRVSCGADGVVRTYRSGRLFELRADGPRPLPSIPAPRFSLRRLVALRDRTLYAFGASEALTVWRFRDGAWTELPSRSAPLPEDGPYVDARGRLWVGYDHGRVGLPLENRLYASGTPGLGHVSAILETSHGHFAAGLNGVAVLRDTSFQVLRFADRASTRGVAGMVESRNGDLWLNAVQGIVRVPAAELAAALANPRHLIRTERITEGEFAGPARASGTRSSAARAADGTLWFSMLNGVVSYDPGARRADKPPVLSIRSITADRVPLGADRRFRPQPRTLAIEYFGVNLAAPDRVRYRYRLEGFDRDWHDAGGRTEAVYTRPGPGTYTFRVMAANESGAWTAPVSSVRFTVLPSFHQTRWFAALVVAAVAAAAWLAYTLRVRAITALVQARAEERADERVRVARELHDTLLGNMAGVAMQLSAGARRVEASAGVDAPVVRLLAGLGAQVQQTMVEARDSVTAMRALPGEHTPLQERLADSARRSFEGTGIAARVEHSGSPHPLAPTVEAEILGIATEAMTNARKHADCRTVTVTCGYHSRGLRVRVRDDGRGFDPSIAAPLGHWGVIGMRERAAAIGATLDVTSAPGAGTEVALALPVGGGRHTGWRRLFPGGRAP